ncbi:MAG TPA: hypothetical protein VK171_03245 [Fimbriimonas sp.]|nr:hypothetical protein [Fimbriimonas sp.]
MKTSLRRGLVASLFVVAGASLYAAGAEPKYSPFAPTKLADRGPVGISKSETLYYDYRTGNLWKVNELSPVLTTKDIYNLFWPTTNPKREKEGDVPAHSRLILVSNDLRAAPGSKIKIRVINLHKDLATIKLTGTELSAPDTSGIANLAALIKALAGNGITADTIKVGVTPPKVELTNIIESLKSCDEIVEYAKLVKAQFDEHISNAGIYADPKLTKFDPTNKPDLAAFDIKVKKALADIAIAIAKDDSVAKLLVEPFTKKTSDARAVLVSSKQQHDKFNRYVDHKDELFADYYVSDAKDEVTTSGSKYQLDLTIKKVDGADITDRSKSYDVVVTGSGPSFFTSIAPVGYARIKENRFFVDNNVAAEATVEDRYGLDNLGLHFNLVPAGQTWGFSLGIGHPWSDLKSLSSDNVSLFVGLSKWYGDYGLVLGYIDQRYKTLAANGAVTTVDDIKTRYGHQGSLYLGFSIKTSALAGSKASTEKKGEDK